MKHAGIQKGAKVNIVYLDAEDIEQQGVSLLNSLDSILVPGGFGKRGIEGKILAAQYAREQQIPYLGICLGMQVAVIEFARHCANMTDANSTEFTMQTKHPVIALVTEWMTEQGQLVQRDETTALGGTMRLGGYWCDLAPNTLAQQMYQKSRIMERHRHRYEVNNALVEPLVQSGLVVSGRSVDGELVEMIELPNHPWFLGCQFHPEFTSTPHKGHPLFNGFVQAAIGYRQNRG